MQVKRRELDERMGGGLKEWLRQQYVENGLSFSELARLVRKEHGVMVTHCSVAAWLREYGLLSPRESDPVYMPIFSTPKGSTTPPKSIRVGAETSLPLRPKIWGGQMCVKCGGKVYNFPAWLNDVVKVECIPCFQGRRIVL